MIGREVKRSPIPPLNEGRTQWIASERLKLKTILRYEPVSLMRPWMLATTKSRGVETLSYMFEMNNRLSASAVWVKATYNPQSAPVTIVLNDQGKRESGSETANRVNRGEQVLAVDLLFMGDSARIREVGNPGPGSLPWTPIYALVPVFHTTGDRALGLEAAQLVEITRWIQQRSGKDKVRLETRGIRSQVVAILSAALEPKLFSEIVAREGMASLSYLLEKPVDYQQAPELFCLDLYQNFELDSLEAMADGVRISHLKQLSSPVPDTSVKPPTQ
jgi:hypothetical protein